MIRNTLPKKRAAKYEVIVLSREFFEEILIRLDAVELEYKTYAHLYRKRDKALIATLLLTGLRASEVTLLKKDQFVKSADLFRILKARTIKGGDLRKKIPLPTKRILSKFTRLITEWLKEVPDGAYVFPRGSGFGINFNDHLNRRRVHQIVYKITGKYPHYYRAVCATLYAMILKDAWELKQFMGWRNLNSSSPYVKSSWEKKEREINEVF